MTKEPIDLIYNFLPYADIPKSHMITAEDRVFIGCDITKGNVMTIEKQLRHAEKYKYRIKILKDLGNDECRYDKGTVYAMGGKKVVLLVRPCETATIHLSNIMAVDVIPVYDDDDTPDSEKAEIDRNETWGCTEYFDRDPKWAVDLRDDSGFGTTFRSIGQFTEEKYAKAAATLPELVRQRDKLLEAANKLVKWEGDYKATYDELGEVIAEIQKNPLIRLVDAE